MCLLMKQVAERHPNLDQWVRETLPALHDLDAQIDAVTRASGAKRETVAHAFRPDPLTPIIGTSTDFPGLVRRHSATVLRFDIDAAMAARFEAQPRDPTAKRLLNAAILFGIAEQVKQPGRVVVAEDLETEVFGSPVSDTLSVRLGGISDRTFPGTPLTSSDISEAAEKLTVGAAHIWAVFSVESRASGFRADRRPKILYERHVFSRLTNGRFDDHPISSRVAGGYGDGTQYERLAMAMRLEPKAGLEACSYGLGQVMGCNYKTVGYTTVEKFVAGMIDGEGPQLAAMCVFIDENGLTDALQNENWKEFSRIYNGPAFKKNEYDTKLAAAFEAAQSGDTPDLELRRDQMFLTYLGFVPGPIDGLDGRKTRAAIRGFQEQHRNQGLTPNGKRDEATVDLLARLVTDLVNSQRGDLV